MLKQDIGWTKASFNWIFKFSSIFGLFLLKLLLKMVKLIASYAFAFSKMGFVCVRTIRCKFRPTILVVALTTHTFSVVLLVCVRTVHITILQYVFLDARDISFLFRDSLRCLVKSLWDVYLRPGILLWGRCRLARLVQNFSLRMTRQLLLLLYDCLTWLAASYLVFHVLLGLDQCVGNYFFFRRKYSHRTDNDFILWTGGFLVQRVFEHIFGIKFIGVLGFHWFQ